MDSRNWGLTKEARERLGRNVMARRLRADMSRQELGSRAAVSTKRVASVEEGLAGATVDVLLRLAGSLPDDSTLDDLLAGVRWIPSPDQSRSTPGGYVVQRRGR